MLVVCLSLAALSLAALVIALRGLRVDDHPVCRRCGYDLTGRTGDRCPECGGDLAKRRAVRVGHRRRRPLWVVACVVVGAASLMVPGRRAYVALRTVRWVEHEPTWLLRRELAGPRYTTALAELTRRVRAGLLSQPQVDAVADRCLAVQADVATTWDPAWGDFVEAAAIAGRVDRTRWELYGEQAFSAALDVARQTPAADVDDEVLFFSLRPRFARLGVDGWWSGQTTIVRCDIDGRPGRVMSMWGDGKVHINAPDWKVFCQHVTSYVWPGRRLSAGNHHLDVIVGLMLPVEQCKVDMKGTDFGPTPPTLVGNVRLAANFTVVPPSFTDQSNAAEAVRRSVSRVETRANPDGSIRLIFHVVSPPARLAFGISAGRKADDHYAVVDGKLRAEPGVTSDQTFELPAEFRTADTVDINLFPIGRRRSKTLDPLPTWGGEVVVLRVPVAHGPTSRPE